MALPYRTPPYQSGDVVRDGAWTMISRSDDNSDRAAPQPTGEPDWVSGLPDTPSWDSPDPSVTESSILTGTRYNIAVPGFATSLRFSFPIADSSTLYEAWLVRYFNSVPSVQQIFSPQEASATGWQTFPIGAFVMIPGDTFDVILRTIAVGAGFSFSANWDQKNQNGDPSEGEMNHQSSLTEMRFHHTDKDDSDQQTNLEAIDAGSTISAGGQNWQVVGQSLFGSHVRYTVTPAYRLSENTYNYSFQAVIADDLEYHQLTDHYLGNTEVRGLKSLSGDINSIVEDNHAYGVDLLATPASVSENWELLSFIG